MPLNTYLKKGCKIAATPGGLRPPKCVSSVKNILLL